MAKRKFIETKIGQFLKKTAPAILDLVDDAFPPVKLLTHLISKNTHLSPEQSAEVTRLMNEYEKEVYALEVRDRDSARKREVDLAREKGRDWMMYLTGIIGLLSFAVVIYAVIWIPAVNENDLFIHLIGMIEGVVVGNIFAYYFGTSKNEK